MPQTRAAVTPTCSTTDAGLIVAARGLRSFAYGLLAVGLGVGLATAGLTPAAIGALITVSLLC